MKAVCYTLSFLNANGADPMGYLRLVAPLREAGIQMISGVEGSKIHPEYVSLGDIVVIQRHFPIHFQEYCKVIEQARIEQKPVVFELDDYLFFLPEIHHDRLTHTFTPSLLPMFQAVLEADVITVPTIELKKLLSPFNRNIVVLPNYLDDHLWYLKQPDDRSSAGEKTVIGYMGTHSHKPDVEMIVPALLEILNRYDRKVEISFWGTQPPDEMRDLTQVNWNPWYSYSYQDFAEYFQTQRVDLFIAPLVDNVFNRCKSPLKFLEYSALGVCGIYSAIPPYCDIITHKKEGLLASSVEEWKESLQTLIENRNMRQELAINAQRLIRQKYFLSENAYRWAKAYRKIIENHQNTTARRTSMLFPVINSINLQLTELLRENEATLQELRNQVSMKDATVQELTRQVDTLRSQLSDYEEEILYYVMSRSWRYTRPLRRLNKSISRLFEQS